MHENKLKNVVNKASAIILDFDGVVLDSEPIHYEASRQVLSDIGLQLSFDEYNQHYIGLSDKEMFPKILHDKKSNFPLNEINGLIKKKVDIYTETISNHDQLPLVSGIDDFIVCMAKQRKKIAICSGSKRQEIASFFAKIKDRQLECYVSVIVTSDDVKHGKPSPEGYLLTAKLLNVLPDDCLVIEDTPHGVTAALEANMRVIAITTTHSKEQLCNAHMVIHHYTELL